MAINVAGLIPASIKSKNVATEDYVDTSVASNVVSNNYIKNSEMIIESVKAGTQWLSSDLWHRRNSGLNAYTAGVTRNKIGEYSPYTLLNGATAWIHQDGAEPEFSADLMFDNDGGQFTYLGHMVNQLDWYQVSGYIGSINCEAKIVVVFSDGVGQIVNQVISEALTGKPGGSYLEDFHNYYINVQVPEGAKYATIIFRKYGTTSGSDSLMFVSKPQFINTIGSSTRRIPYSENGNASGLSGMAYADMRNVTTIDGSKITTGSIDALQIASNAISGKTITGGTINGAIINGVQINGAIIKGSFIDLTSTITLTNWQFYTPATIPPAYVSNFAHNNDGTLTVDSSGFVRLPGQTNFIVGQMVSSATVWAGNLSNVHVNQTANINLTYDLYSWNSYMVNTLQRSIRNNTQFSTGGNLVFKVDCLCDDFYNSGTDTVNYGTVNYRVLDTDISIWVQASNGNEHTAEIASISFNGATVAYGDGRYGEQSGSDCASLDFNSTIKGLPINIKVLFNGGASFFITSTISVSANSIITNHTNGDVFRIDNVNFTLNTAGTSAVGYTSGTYSVNYPSLWVQ